MSKPAKSAKKPTKKTPAPASKKGKRQELTADELVQVSGGGGGKRPPTAAILKCSGRT